MKDENMIVVSQTFSEAEVITNTGNDKLKA
jgi:hypothetical protein